MGTDVKSSGSLENDFEAALTAPCPLPAPKGRIKKRKHDVLSNYEDRPSSPDQVSDPDTGSSSVFDSESDSDKQMSEGEYTEGSNDDYCMFDPEESSNSSQWGLSSTENKLVDKYFTFYVNDEVDREQIMKSTPIPSNPTLDIPELDSEWLGLIPGRSETVTAEDSAMSGVQTKLTRTMGQLGRLWKQLDAFRKASKG